MRQCEVLSIGAFQRGANLEPFRQPNKITLDHFVMVRIHARQIVDSKRLTQETPGLGVQALSSPYLVSRRTRVSMDATLSLEASKRKSQNSIPGGFDCDRDSTIGLFARVDWTRFASAFAIIADGFYRNHRHTESQL
jgi:hypothetical protein